MTSIKEYDGRTIIEDVEYTSATVLKRTPDRSTVLVKLQDGVNLLIEITTTWFAGQGDKKIYDVYSGMNVDKLAEEYEKCNCVAHNLLLEMKA